MTEEMKRKIKKIVVMNGYNRAEYYPDQSDDFHLDSKKLSEVLHSDDPFFVLDEYARWAFEEWIVNTEDEIFHGVIGELGLDEDDLDEGLAEEIRELLWEIAPVDPPTEKYLEAVYEADIFVDTGDGNYDFAANLVYPHYDGRQGERVPKEFCLGHLARWQGYGKRELYRVLNGERGDAFEQSCYDELLNCTTSVNQLVFLRQMTLEELIAWKREKTPVTIPKSTTCGLFDAWNGAGGLLGIELARDFRLPAKFIEDIIPDDSLRYGIKDVYGTDETLWE